MRAMENMAGFTRSNLLRQCRMISHGWGEEAGKPRERGVYASQRLSFRSRGQACLWKMRAEPRSEPDSGNPTVRDRREALRNVTTGLDLWPGAKATEMSPAPTVRALNFYPDNRTYGSLGDRGNGSAPRAPRL